MIFAPEKHNNNCQYIDPYRRTSGRFAQLILSEIRNNKSARKGNIVARFLY